MRIAALYDIHGNLPALEAVLGEVRQAGVDAVVLGGDVVVGPMSREALDAVMALECPVHAIAGNCEREVLAVMAGQEPTTVPEAHRGIVRWTAGTLTPAHRTRLALWPATLRMAIAGIGDVLFCHATPRNDTDIVLATTDEARLRPLVDPLDAALVVCGHTHMPYDRRVGRTRVVNAGSVGMPFGAAGADWILIGPDVQFRHTTYDLECAARRVRETAYPQAEAFAATSILHPPDAETMRARFGAAEVQ